MSECKHGVNLYHVCDECRIELIESIIDKLEHPMVKMRAKLSVNLVQEHFYGKDGVKSGETLSMCAVSATKYPEDGSDEDNTYAKFSPGASFVIQVANPALWGQFKFGDRFYVDFTRAE